MSLRFLLLRSLRLIAVAHFVFACVSLLVAQQQPKVLAPHKPIAPKVGHSYPMPAPVAGSMVGGPWMVDANFKSSVYIKNSVETSAVTVTPVLYLSNGVAYKLSDIALEPSGTSILDIGASLEKLGIAPYATLSGYIELQYNWPWDPICGTIRNFDPTHSLIFNYGLRSSKAPDLPGAAVKSTSRTSRVVEGLWWKQEANVSGFVTLTNTTSQSLSANVELSDDAGRTFSQQTAQISPHGTKMLEMNDLATTQAASGGIRITYSGTATDLLVNGGLEDIGVGYSAGIPFSTAPATSTPSSITVAELGLMTGPADPMMRFPAGTTFSPYTVLRNVSNSVITATPTLWWMADGTAHSFQLSVLSLAPLQSQSVDFSGFLTQAGLKDFSGNVQLAFQVQGNAGGLLIAAGSVDKANTYVFEVTPHAVAESASKSLSYWNIADGDDTMVTIWNPADEAQDFIFQLTYTGGHYNYPIHLEARSTRTFNISDIVESGIPDADGDVIPATVHDGGAEIMGSNAENEHILVNIDSGVYNVRKATCGLYCQSCNGVTSSSVADNPFVVAVSKQHQLTLYETWNTGSQYNDSSYSNWRTSASSIATVGTMGSGTPGSVSGVSPGSPTITAQYIYDEPSYTNYWCEGSSWSCPYQYTLISAGSSGSVPPTLTLSTPLWFLGPGIAAPANWSLGNTQSVVTASGASGGTFNWSITGGILSFSSSSQQSTTSTSGNSVTVYSTGASTSADDVTIQLTWVPSGGGNVVSTMDLSVDSPYEATFVSNTDYGYQTSCSDHSGTVGYSSWVEYQLMSYFGVTITNIGVNEAFGSTVSDYTNENWGTITALPGYVETDGDFDDNICAHSSTSTPRTLPPGSPLGTTQVIHASQSIRVGSITSGAGVQVLTNTHQLYQDHGRWLNPASPP
ncbi:MAG: hypothetical protein WAM85_13150 [Terracidiphilus sp.]